jgi:hypothetical protein
LRTTILEKYGVQITMYGWTGCLQHKDAKSRGLVGLESSLCSPKPQRGHLYEFAQRENMVATLAIKDQNMMASV